VAFHCAAHRLPVEQELELIRWLRDLLLLLWRAQVDLLDLVQLSLLRVLLLLSPRTLFLPLLLLQLAGSASSKVCNLTFSATQARTGGVSARRGKGEGVRGAPLRRSGCSSCSLRSSSSLARRFRHEHRLRCAVCDCARFEQLFQRPRLCVQRRGKGEIQTVDTACAVPCTHLLTTAWRCRRQPVRRRRRLRWWRTRRWWHTDGGCSTKHGRRVSMKREARSHVFHHRA